MILLLMIMIDTWRDSQNMVFKKEVLITRSKWLVTFIIDLNPYEFLLDKMEDELVKLQLRQEIYNNLRAMANEV